MPADRILPSSAAAAGLALSATVKYNPHLWGPDELRSIFVVRTRELADLLERLRATPEGQVPQHLLVTGSRGMGKTTLLRRFALAVEEDSGLAARWIAVTFPEEQYTVGTLAELWRNCLDALTDAREREGAPPAELDRLDAEIRRIGELPVGEREAAARASLEDWVQANGRRLLLLIDSTDLLLANLAASAGPGAARPKKTRREGDRIDGGATPLWRLRNTLSHEPGIFWLGASYLALETEHAYQDAFWDFFDRLELRPLQVSEMRSAMLALARTFGAGRGLIGEAGEREMARTLDSRPERLRALRAITGGNPRTTVMLYELFAAGGSDDVHSDLRRLLDTMTPLYKARMETLSDQARKLLAHLMEHWAPVSARTLGELSGITTNTVSGQLVRLEAEGLVEKAALQGSRKAGYQAAERLFNVWYLMRYASRRVRQRLGWLVEFMRLWYSSEEMSDLARLRAGQHAGGRLCRAEHLEFSRALSLALPDGHADRYRLEWAVFGAAHRNLVRDRDRGRTALPEYFELDGEDREYTTAEDYLRRFEVLDERLARCPHLTDETKTEWIQVVKGSFDLTLAEKESAAESAKDLTVEEYRRRVATLCDKRKRWERNYGLGAIQLVRDAVLAGHFFPDCPDSKLAHHQILGCFGEDREPLALALRLFDIRHHDEWAEKVARYAVERTPEYARAWNNLGNWLKDQHNREQEAENAYRRAIELDPKAAWPWHNLGNLLSDQAGRADEAEVAYRRAIELDPEDALPWNKIGLLLADDSSRMVEAEAAYHRAIELDPADAWPWGLLGLLLSGQSVRAEEAEAAYRRATELDPGEAWPWGLLGLILSDQPSRAEEAEATYRRAIEIDPNDAWLWGRLGNLLSDQAGQSEEAEAAYRRAIELDPKAAGPWDLLGNLLSGQPGRAEEAEASYHQAIELDPKAAWPWNDLGVLLSDQAGRAEEAEAAYRRAIELDPKAAWSWGFLGNLLSAQSGRVEEAEGAYRRAIELDPKEVWSWNDLGVLLSDQAGRAEEAEAAYRRAIELDPKAARPWINLGDLLSDQPRRAEEAATAYRHAIELDPGYSGTWDNLGNLLADKLCRLEEAEAAYREAIRLDEEDTYPITNLARLLAALGRQSEADASYRQAVSLAQAADDRAAATGAPSGGHGAQYFGHAQLLLQAHLWLGNRDLARQALDRLAGAAAGGNKDAFAKIREQIRECHAIGLGPALRDLMNASPWADLLQPFALALGAAAAADPAEPLAGAPAELRTVAEEVLASLQGTRAGADATIRQTPES
jgi:Flp pilus assembly protein TadD/energy-coupling factor transporter ATP-binding protein EcfA2